MTVSMDYCNGSSRTTTVGRGRPTAGCPFRVVPTGVECHSIRDYYRLWKLIGLVATSDDRPDQAVGVTHTDWVSNCIRRLLRSTAISTGPAVSEQRIETWPRRGLATRRRPVSGDSIQRRLEVGTTSGESSAEATYKPVATVAVSGGPSTADLSEIRYGRFGVGTPGWPRLRPHSMGRSFRQQLPSHGGVANWVLGHLREVARQHHRYRR